MRAVSQSTGIRGQPCGLWMRRRGRCLVSVELRGKALSFWIGLALTTWRQRCRSSWVPLPPHRRRPARRRNPLHCQLVVLLPFAKHRRRSAAAAFLDRRDCDVCCEAAYLVLRKGDKRTRSGPQESPPHTASCPLSTTYTTTHTTDQPQHKTPGHTANMHFTTGIAIFAALATSASASGHYPCGETVATSAAASSTEAPASDPNDPCRCGSFSLELMQACVDENEVIDANSDKCLAVFCAVR